MEKLCNRSIRIGQELQKKIAFIIQTSLNDPRIKIFITVSKVIVSQDLSHARVFVSFLSKNKDMKIKEILIILNKSTGYIRKLLCKDMRLRIMPNIVFYYDDSLLQGNKISKMLKDVLKNQ